MPEAGDRASDHIAMQQGITLAEHSITLRAHTEEIEKVRIFKHDINNAVQTLVTKVGNIESDMAKVLQLGDRVAKVEEDQAVHAAKCDERYKAIAEYMADSKTDRAAINKKISDGSNRVLLGLLLASVSIIAAFLWRFGLPPMGN